jgi:hypothetical protein
MNEPQRVVGYARVSSAEQAEGGVSLEEQAATIAREAEHRGWTLVAIRTVWDLRRWLASNVWESEDGPSQMSLAYRDYYWDHGMCWLDSSNIAISGIGDDDDRMIDGSNLHRRRA